MHLPRLGTHVVAGQGVVDVVEGDADLLAGEAPLVRLAVDQDRHSLGLGRRDQLTHRAGGDGDRPDGTRTARLDDLLELLHLLGGVEVRVLNDDLPALGRAVALDPLGQPLQRRRSQRQGREHQRLGQSGGGRRSLRRCSGLRHPTTRRTSNCWRSHRQPGAAPLRPQRVRRRCGSGADGVSSLDLLWDHGVIHFHIVKVTFQENARAVTARCPPFAGTFRTCDQRAYSAA